jgi:hypothetical protein
MSLVKISGNASGTGEFTIAAPNTNTDYTLTLPQATTTIVGTDATQTLTNKTINGGALQSATSQASTSGTSIDFTGIPSWVKRITVMFNGVSTNGTTTPLIRLGDSGGIETTGYVTSISVMISTVATASYTSGFPLQDGISTAALISGAVTISLLNASTNTWVATGGITRDTAHQSLLSGSKSLSDTLTQVRITTVNGTDTFDAGTINILFE